MALSHGIPNELVKAILALMSADNSDDMATLWGSARIAFEHAEADARADGYAEAKEQAAKLADRSGGVVKDGHWDVPIGDAIRALAPATTKEP